MFFQYIELSVVQPCNKSSSDKTSCYDFGIKPREVWLEQTDVVVRTRVEEGLCCRQIKAEWNRGTPHATENTTT